MLLVLPFRREREEPSPLLRREVRNGPPLQLLRGRTGGLGATARALRGTGHVWRRRWQLLLLLIVGDTAHGERVMDLLELAPAVTMGNRLWPIVLVLRTEREQPAPLLRREIRNGPPLQLLRSRLD